MNYPNLSKSLQVGPLNLPNRVVMPPLVIWAANEDGTANEAVFQHYSACTGLGMVVVEATVVSPEGRLASHQLGAFDDAHLRGLTELAKRIHTNGSVASIQIHHAGRQTNTKNTLGLPSVAPSAHNPGGETPLELTGTEIERIVNCFVSAAQRMVHAGFDAVEIHGAHGYLASQFLSPAANLRTDKWGGSLENRARFLREVIRRVRQAVGDKILVYCRLGVVDAEPGGLTLDEGVQVARWLEQDGVPLLHVSNGIGLPTGIAPEGNPFSDRMHLAAAVKRAVGIPVIGVGGIRTPEEAEAALTEGLADLVAVGKGILADRAWANKSLSGNGDKISLCRLCRACHHYKHPEKCPARRA